jgi:hypothetical protein
LKVRFLPRSPLPLFSALADAVTSSGEQLVDYDHERLDEVLYVRPEYTSITRFTFLWPKISETTSFSRRSICRRFGFSEA